MKNILITLLLILIAGSYVLGQNKMPGILNSTGGSTQKGYYVLDWSVGELALVNQMHSSNDSYVFTNGFIQPFVYDNRINAANKFEDDEIRIHPNPTHGKLTIDVRTRQKGTLWLRVNGAQGPVLYTKQLYHDGYGHLTEIDITTIPTGTYILRVDLYPEPGYVRKKGAYRILKL